MTVSFKKLGKGSGGGEYYLSAASVDDYYLNDGTSDDPNQQREPPGTWYDPSGSAPVALHGGKVEASQFRALMGGYSPETGEYLVKGDPEDHVAGYDFTFSAPKGVSVLWAQAGDEARATIEAAQQAAVEKALAYLSERAWIARSGSGGAVREHVQLIAALWPHGSSRENDPQLHTHSVLMNLARCADGTYRTIDPQLALAYQSAIAGIYHACLADELRSRLGVVCERASGEYVFDAAGVPGAVKEHFSKRSAQIAEAAAELAPDSLSKAMLAKLALETRDAKDELTRAELRERWATEGELLGFSRAEAEALLDHVLREPGVLDAESAGVIAQQVALQLTATQSVFTEARLHAAIAVELQGRAGPDAMAQVLAAGEGVFVALGHDDRGIPVYSTADMVATEQRMIDLALASCPEHTIPEADVAAAIALKPTMSEAQAEAVRVVCAATTRVCVIEGAPGAGKSFALDAVREAHERAGYTLHALALSWSAAGVLAEEARAKNARAIEGFLRDVESGRLPLGARPLLMIDEAGLVGSRSMARLLDAAERAGAKVILSGDTRQLKPVDAGGAMAAIVSELPLNRMDEIRRQHTEWQRDAVAEFGQGKAAEALARYEAAGAVHLHETNAATCDALLANWRDAHHAGKSTLIIATTNVEVAALNTRARAILREQGHLSGEEIVIRSSDLRHSREAAFAIGDQIQFRQNDPMMGVVDGRDRTSGVYNRTRGQITGIERDPSTGDPVVTVRLDRGGDVRFVAGAGGYWDKERGGCPIQHAYASTVYSAQGMTVDRAFVMYGDGMRRDNAYVAMSRHREAVDIYADTRSLHAAMMSKASADAFQQRKQVPREAYLAHMAKQASRASDKSTTLDYLREREAGVGPPSRVPKASHRVMTDEQAQAREAQRIQARAVDLPHWLQSQGYEPTREGKGWKLRTPDGTARLFRGRGEQWLVSDGTNTTDAIGFVRKLEGVGLREAVARLAAAPAAAPVLPREVPPLQVRLADDAQRANVMRYARQERGISSATLSTALRQRFCALEASGLAFIGYDEKGRTRSIETRLIAPVEIDGKPVTKRSYPDSDKAFPPILHGNSREVAIVEGGFDALALHDIARRQGQEPPTVLVTGGVRTLRWQESAEVQALLKAAERVTIHRDNERDTKIQARSDTDASKQRDAIVRVRGREKGVQEVRPTGGHKDAAAVNAAAAREAAERRAAALRAAQEEHRRQQGSSLSR